MIKALHGKRYYITLDRNEFDDVTRKISNSSLADEVFHTRGTANNRLVLYSDARVEDLRGRKYRDWRKITASVYVAR